MRRAVWGALLAVTSCAASAPPVAAPRAPAPPVATPAAPASPAGEVTAVWEVERADPASPRVDLTYLAAACSAVRRIAVEETAERVVITLGNGGYAGRECTEPLLRHRTVTLKAPLGGRDLYDGGADPPVLVRAG